MKIIADEKAIVTSRKTLTALSSGPSIRIEASSDSCIMVMSRSEPMVMTVPAKQPMHP